MTRQTFDPSDDIPSEPMADALAHRRPCIVCTRSTLVTILTQYGGRCMACYADFCAAPKQRIERKQTITQREMLARARRGAGAKADKTTENPAAETTNDTNDLPRGQSDEAGPF